MTSPWTHAICEDCFRKITDIEPPYRMKEPEEEDCCFCGYITESGIYYRADPNEVRCKGTIGRVHRSQGVDK